MKKINNLHIFKFKEHFPPDGERAPFDAIMILLENSKGKFIGKVKYFLNDFEPIFFDNKKELRDELDIRGGQFGIKWIYEIAEQAEVLLLYGI